MQHNSSEVKNTANIYACLSKSFYTIQEEKLYETQKSFDFDGVALVYSNIDIPTRSWWSTLLIELDMPTEFWK